jgi:hypothetical protein
LSCHSHGAQRSPVGPIFSALQRADTGLLALFQPTVLFSSLTGDSGRAAARSPVEFSASVVADSLLCYDRKEAGRQGAGVTALRSNILAGMSY